MRPIGDLHDPLLQLEDRASRYRRYVRERMTEPRRRSSRPLRSLGASTMLVGLLAVASSAGATAQSSTGGTGSTAGGALLGFYSGAGMGLVGTLMPCNRTLTGSRCTATTALVGGALGLAMGGAIGAENRDAVGDRTADAAIGAAIGAGLGLGLRYAVRQYGWTDVFALAAVGGAFGAASEGVAWGAAAGATTGLVLWLVRPESGLPDALLLLVGGAALGGFYDWIDGASTARRGGTPQFSTAFSLPFS